MIMICLFVPPGPTVQANNKQPDLKEMLHAASGAIGRNEVSAQFL